MNKTCPECGACYVPAGGRAALCARCSAKADVIIRSMVREGHLSRTIAHVVKLSIRAVNNRRSQMGLRQVDRRLLIRKPLFLIGEPKPPAMPAPVKPVCKWPSGNPAREMHICCRAQPRGLTCDADAA